MVHATFACSDGDEAAPSGGSGGAQSGGAAGSPSSGGTAGNAAGSGNAGSTGSSGGASSGGASGSAGFAGAAASGGASGAGSGGAIGDAQVPPPADGGGSIYAVRCSGDSRPCGLPPAHCLGIQLDEGGTGFTCSNRCQSDADCSTAPSGAEAKAGCVPFTQQSRCVLVCENSGRRFSCPSGMSCYTYPGATIGYCLWF